MRESAHTTVLKSGAEDVTQEEAYADPPCSAEVASAITCGLAAMLCVLLLLKIILPNRRISQRK